MNSLNRIMSYDKSNKKLNIDGTEKVCNCEECVSKIIEIKKFYSFNDFAKKLTSYHLRCKEREIYTIINLEYWYKDNKTKWFIIRALRKHGNKYIYHKTRYIKVDKYVVIECKIEGHGSFLQTPAHHLLGQGCKLCGIKKCAESKKSTTKKFIEKANKIHGEGRYDYSKVKYIDSSTEIIIICHNHEKSYEFQQKPNNHLNGQGCPICRYIKTSEKLRMTLEEFIEKANKIHGKGTYDYSKVEYINNNTGVTIICPKHDEFIQTPQNHLNGNGCKLCAIEKQINRQRLELEEFIKRANKIHGIGTYDYSKVNYVNMYTNVIIICPKHGDFLQTPQNHLNYQGCPKCNKNKGEDLVRKFLTEKGIEFEEQKTFEGCKNINLLKFDFYLPKYNLCIESDGSPHYRKVNWNGKMTDEEMKENLKLNQHRDNIKNEYCEKNGIGLLRLNNIKTFEEKLTEYFQTHGIIKEQTIF